MRAWVLVALAAMAARAGADELDALDVVERAAPPPTVVERAWQAWGEWGSGQAHSANARQSQYRAALAVRWDAALFGPWRSVGAVRLDLAQPAMQAGESAIATVQEAYVAWRGDAHWALDLGRVQAHYGVASGYNPTDYLRSGAQRVTMPTDPLSVGPMRQGSVLLRTQWVGEGGAWALLLSPALGQAAEPGESVGGGDWNLRATNPAARAVASYSPRGEARSSLQWLAFADERQMPQWGVNATALWGQATVLQAQASVGRARSQWAQSWQTPQDSAVQQRWTVGASHTTAARLSVTVEASYNSAAPDATQWQQLQSAPAPAYAAYRAWVAQAQELTTRRSWTLHARWEQALNTPRLELSALWCHNPEDHSQLHWLEARYRWSVVQGFVQWQRSLGGARSEWGGLPWLQAWQLGARWHW